MVRKTLEELKADSNKLGITLMEIVGEKNLAEINEWAFEYALQGARLMELSWEETRIYQLVKRYLVYTEVYRALKKIMDQHPNAGPFGYELLSKSVIPELIKKERVERLSHSDA